MAYTIEHMPDDDLEKAIQRLEDWYPRPWKYEGGRVLAADNRRVWDVDDANDDPMLAQEVVRIINLLAPRLALAAVKESRPA